MASIIPDMLDMMPDTITVQPGSLDGFGKFTDSGAPFDVRCYISAKTKLLRSSDGREITSSAKAIMAGVNDLTVEAHRYTLPIRFNPRVDLRAITVDRPTDEDGPHHETLFFP